MGFIKWLFSGTIKIVLFFAINALLMMVHPLLPFIVMAFLVLYFFYKVERQ